MEKLEDDFFVSTHEKEGGRVEVGLLAIRFRENTALWNKIRFKMGLSEVSKNYIFSSIPSNLALCIEVIKGNDPKT